MRGGSGILIHATLSISRSPERGAKDKGEGKSQKGGISNFAMIGTGM